MRKYRSVSIVLALVVLGMFVASGFSCCGLMTTASDLQEMVASTKTAEAGLATAIAGATAVAQEPQIPTPNFATCIAPPPDSFVEISQNVPTAWDAFVKCFEECVEANNGEVYAIYFGWWLNKNEYPTVESANLVHEGDIFYCYSKPGWWSGEEE